MSNILPVGLVGCLTGQDAPLTCFAVPVLPYLPRALPSHCTAGRHTGWFPSFFVRPSGGRGSSALSPALC